MYTYINNIHIQLIINLISRQNKCIEYWKLELTGSQSEILINIH